jgi:hypothetical protein
MKTWTYDEVKTKVMRELDLESEDFITPEEMMSYCNEAIDIAEAEIHSLHETYFLTSDTLTLVSGTSAYAMPSDIYGTKFAEVRYENGSDSYEIPHLNKKDRFARVADTTSGDTYSYLITNTAGTGFRMVFTPTPDESGAYIKRWYIRNAAEVADDADALDIPEFGINFVVQMMKLRCKEKEGIATPADYQMVNEHRKVMVEALSDMTPDGGNELEMDLSFYDFHS